MCYRNTLLNFESTLQRGVGVLANTRGCAEGIHPFIIEGQGHTAISNVEAFSGKNGALSAEGYSDDFALIQGDKHLTVSMYGCRMRNYRAEEPITIENPHAHIQALLCVDKNEQFFELK